MIKLSNIDLPKSPGVYHFLDEGGLVLYVGKAKNLKNRIKQYFLKELGRGPAIEQMVRMAADIKWIETDSEIEAVLLEAELIKKLKPKYNVRLKDDKSFLVIKIEKYKCVIPAKAGILSNKTKIPGQARNDIGKEFPCIELVRFKDVDLKDKSADYFGPYPAGLLLKKSLRYLRRIFPYRDCSKTKFNIQKKQGRTCIYGDIRVCSGPCNNWIGPKEYQKNIDYLKDFLRGKKKMIAKNLEREMNDLSKERRFEEAALIRNRLQALSHLREVSVGLRDDAFHIDQVIFKRIECYDISNIGEEFAVGSMVVFQNGKPDRDEYRKFKVKSMVGLPNSDLERLRQVLGRRFQNDWPKPDLVIIDGGELQLRVAKEVLKELNLDVAAISISKGRERKKNDFHYADQNLAKYFAGNKALQNLAIAARDEAHRFAISYYRNIHKKEMFR